MYTSEDSSWSQPDVSGSPPCARHGHVSVAVGTDIYIHGGMAGTNMYDDLYKFNTGRLNINLDFSLCPLCPKSYLYTVIECTKCRRLANSGDVVIRWPQVSTVLLVQCISLYLQFG